MNSFLKNTSKDVRGEKTYSTDMGVDSEDEMNALLEKAVVQYKNNKKNSSCSPISTTKHRKRIIKNHCNDSKDMNVNKPNGEIFLEQISGNNKASSDLLDLINYFMVPKSSQGEVFKKETYDHYEKQGAIPKRLAKHKGYYNESSDKYRVKNKGVISASNSTHLEGNHFKAHDRGSDLMNNGKETMTDNAEILENFKEVSNLNLESPSGVDKAYSRPFFYIVPEKPCTNFVLPRGSYYVIPKTPDSFCEETIIFHPESSISFTREQELSSRVEIISKAQEVDPNSIQNMPKSLNDLGKDASQRIDSHLNIGPIQVKEMYFIENLETSWKHRKVFHKTVMSNENFPEGLEDNWSSVEKFFSEESENERPEASNRPVDADLAAGLLCESEPENIDVDLKLLQKQFKRMVKALPDSRIEDLQNKCYEFQGDEEKVSAYIIEVQKENKLLENVRDLQNIFPDADPDFLFKKIRELEGDVNAVNILSDKLLDEQNYPKISVETITSKKKLWQDYVRNFQVKKYLRNVPKPEDFAGVAGDNNKTEEMLIIQFLMSRYPGASESFLIEQFNLNQRNVTKTCASLSEREVVRLSESKFEHANFSDAFLKEICYIDHREEIDNYLESQKVMKEIEEETARLDGAFLYCPLCDDEEVIASEALPCPEGHVFCKACIRRYFEVRLGDDIYKFQCPFEGCEAFFTTSTLEELLPENLSSIVFRKQQTEEINAAEVDGLEFCSQCNFACIPDPESNIFKCQNPVCLEETCRKCGQKNHVPLRCEEIERSVDVEARKKIEEAMTAALVRRCPNCQRNFIRQDGCNKIACVCGAIVCYICRKIITGYGHFVNNNNNNNNNNGCPLHSSNNALHERYVIQAGVRVRDEILNEHPDVRIVNDPTQHFS